VIDLNRRYFVAVNLPLDLRARARIFEVYSRHIPDNGFKVVPKNNVHTTLAFIGWWPGEKERELAAKLSSVKHPAFELELNGIGHFNHRVIWLGTTKGGREMEALAQKTLQALEIKEERFHPHFTLARARYPVKKEVAPVLEKLQAREFKESVQVKSFELMQSHLKPSGPVYTVVESFPLD
jgi:2'-5' RNA ligase